MIAREVCQEYGRGNGGKGKHQDAGWDCENSSSGRQDRLGACRKPNSVGAAASCQPSCAPSAILLASAATTRALLPAHCSHVACTARPSAPTSGAAAAPRPLEIVPEEAVPGQQGTCTAAQKAPALWRHCRCQRKLLLFNGCLASSDRLSNSLSSPAPWGKGPHQLRLRHGIMMNMGLRPVRSKVHL